MEVVSLSQNCGTAESECVQRALPASQSMHCVLAAGAAGLNLQH